MKTLSDFIQALQSANGVVTMKDGIATFEDGTSFVIPQSPSSWENDAIQFPRLIAEINATQELNLPALADSMDLNVDEVEELFDRADTEWESIKARSM